MRVDLYIVQVDPLYSIFESSSPSSVRPILEAPRRRASPSEAYLYSVSKTERKWDILGRHRIAARVCEGICRLVSCTHPDLGRDSRDRHFLPAFLESLRMGLIVEKAAGFRGFELLLDSHRLQAKPSHLTDPKSTPWFGILCAQGVRRHAGHKGGF